MIQEGYISVRNNKIYCKRVGHGQKLLIALHGFANTNAIFIDLAKAIQNTYTCILIDLPGHGKTEWNDRLLEVKDVMAIIQGFKVEFNVERLSLLGFSLGGRICQKIVEVQPDWIEELFLIASDGMQKNIWYQLATQYFFGRKIFVQVFKHPQKYLKYMEWFKNRGWINESKFKFVEKNVSNPDINQLITYTWLTTRHLVPSSQLVKWNINKHNIRTEVFMGKHDKIFPVSIGEKFVKNLQQANLHLLDAGHLLLNEQTTPDIAAKILAN